MDIRIDTGVEQAQWRDHRNWRELESFFVESDFAKSVIVRAKGYGGMPYSMRS